MVVIVQRNSTIQGNRHPQSARGDRNWHCWIAYAEFILLIAIANVIAWPVAYYLMSGWLENFASRTNVGVTTFILAIAGTLIVALLTVSFQVIRAARANPVKAIRYE